MNTTSTAEDRRPLKSRSLGWVQNLAASLARRGITPNGISTTGVVFAAIGCALLVASAHGWLPAGICFLATAILVQARLMCNLLDGLVAVEGGKKSKGGDLFNEIPDRLEDTLFLAGAGYACGHVGLGWFCAVLAVFTAYVRAFGASLGHGQDFGGPCAKPQRMALLTVGLVIGGITAFFRTTLNPLAWALYAIAAGTLLTSVLRVRRLYSRSK